MQIKIACGQIEIAPGHPELNYAKIQATLAQARAENVDILLLPEMCVPGHLIGDIWEQESYLEDCEYYTQEIIKASQGLCVVLGSVAREPGLTNEDGRVRKYNVAYVAQDGKCMGGYLGRPYVIKTSMANYRGFDEDRHFYSLAKLCAQEGAKVENALQPISVSIRGTRLQLGILLCEDGWTENYHFNVPRILAQHGAQLLLNLASAPFSLGKNEKRHRLFAAQAQDAGVPLIYCSCLGIQNNGKDIYSYDGSSSCYDSSGKLLSCTPMYNEALPIYTYDCSTGGISAPAAPLEQSGEDKVIYQTISYGARKFLEQCHISRMTIGLSGGIDSAVTAAMYCHLLGPENVLLINLPSQYNSETTKGLAYQLAKNLGANYAIIPISQSVEHTVDQLTHTPIANLCTRQSVQLELTTLMQENIQARDRGARILAAASAAFGGAFSCNGNKAEAAVGYATFYGDIAGALTMLGDLWKHQVYALGRYLNEHVFEWEVIPDDIFTIRPSAELSAAQTVGTGGDPLVYPYHDYLLRAFVENWYKATPADILEWYVQGCLAAKLGCEPQLIDQLFPTPAAFIEDLEYWWKLFAGFSVAKRIQAPPVLAVSKRSFGSDYRESQLSPYFSRRYLQLKNELLQTK